MEMPQTSLLKSEPIDFAGIANKYQQLAHSQQMMPIAKDQAEANLQTTLTQNESDRLKLAQQAREMSFRNWTDKNPPVMDENGNIDAGQTYKNITDAGFGQFALSHMAEDLNVQSQNVKNKDEVNQLAIKQAKLLSQANQNQLAEKQKEVAQLADNFFKSKFGISITDVAGPNWISSSKYQSVSPLEIRASQRSDEETLTSPDAKDPNSTLNKAFQSFVQQNAPGLYSPTLTLFASKSIPGLNESVKSFLLTQQNRVELNQTQTEAKVKIDRLKTILDDFNQISNNYYFKPLEKLANSIKKILNTEDVSNLQQIVQRLKEEGINVTLEDNPSGWNNTIKAKINELEQRASISGSQKSSVSFNPSPAPASSTPSKNTSGGVRFRTPQGIVTIPKERLNEMKIQQKLKEVGAVRIP